MEWEQKVEMIRLHNQGKQREMQDMVDPFITDLDPQAEDMLFMALELSYDNIKQNKSFFEKLYHFVKKSTAEFGYKTALRREFFTGVFEEIHLKQPE